VNVAVPTPPPHGGEDAVVFLLTAGFLLHIKSVTPNHRITESNTGMGKTVLIFFLDNLCSEFIDSDTGTERCETADGCPRRVCHGMQPTIDDELTSSSASHANHSRRSKVGCQMSSDEIVYRYAQPLRNAQYTPTNKGDETPFPSITLVPRLEPESSMHLLPTISQDEGTCRGIR
jgi:hypothetical protein